MLRKLLIAVLASFVSSAAFAVYNANGSFVITGVLTYTETDSIYITVSAPPNNPACTSTHFVIPGSTPADRRKALLARLLLAKATNETINIGYDATGDCAEGYIRVHRIG